MPRSIEADHLTAWQQARRRRKKAVDRLMALVFALLVVAMTWYFGAITRIIGSVFGD